MMGGRGLLPRGKADFILSKKRATAETGPKSEMIYRTFEKFILAVGKTQTKSRSSGTR